jgi:peptidoglycan DL-endopeptidase CwlO
MRAWYHSYGLSSDRQGGNELSIRLRTYLALLLAAALATTVTPAFAITSAQKMAQAQSVKKQIDALNTRVDIADEKYLVAADKHSKLLSQTRAAKARLAKAQKRLNKLEKHLDTRANDMYRNGPLGFLDVLLGAQSFDQFARTWDVLKQLNAEDAKRIGQTKVARAEAKVARNELSTKEKAAARQVAVMAGNKRYITGLLSERKQKLGGIEAEVARLQAQEAAAELAASRARARSASYSSSSSDNYATPSIPAHGDVVDFAESRIGCPYRWAASGPNAFDCSGLAMWCYGKIGISLPHSSSAQIHSGQRVSKPDLQPGDLVFFGSPIHHVGIYVGGGEMIEAPYSGARVRRASAFRHDYAGACRPN